MMEGSLALIFNTCSTYLHESALLQVSILPQTDIVAKHRRRLSQTASRAVSQTHNPRKFVD